MAQTSRESGHWTAAVSSAGLGLPIAKGTRLRSPKRLVARLLRPFLRQQVEFNQQILAVLVEVRDALAEDVRSVATRSAVEAEKLSQRLGEVGAASERLVELDAALDRVVTRLEERGWAIDAILPALERQGYAIETIEEAVSDTRTQVGRLEQIAERGELEMFARIYDGLGILRRELGDLTLSVEARFAQLDVTGASDHQEASA